MTSPAEVRLACTVANPAAPRLHWSLPDRPVSPRSLQAWGAVVKSCCRLIRLAGRSSSRLRGRTTSCPLTRSQPPDQTSPGVFRVSCSIGPLSTATVGAGSPTAALALVADGRSPAVRSAARNAAAPARTPRRVRVGRGWFCRSATSCSTLACGPVPRIAVRVRRRPSAEPLPTLVVGPVVRPSGPGWKPGDDHDLLSWSVRGVPHVLDREPALVEGPRQGNVGAPQWPLARPPAPGPPPASAASSRRRPATAPAPRPAWPWPPLRRPQRDRPRRPRTRGRRAGRRGCRCHTRHRVVGPRAALVGSSARPGPTRSSEGTRNARGDMAGQPNRAGSGCRHSRSPGQARAGSPRRRTSPSGCRCTPWPAHSLRARQPVRRSGP